MLEEYTGNCDVKFSYIGYKDIIKTIQLDNHKRVNIELIESEDLLEEMIVSAEQSDENTTSTQMGKVELSMDKIKTIPAFMGEVDILKTIQFLPGVSSGGEGNTGFYVRSIVRYAQVDSNRLCGRDAGCRASAKAGQRAQKTS